MHCPVRQSIKGTRVFQIFFIADFQDGVFKLFFYMQKKKTKLKGFVSMDEMIQMKAMKLMNTPVAKIAKQMGRTNRTVQRSLDNFEQVLPEAADLKNSVLERIEEIKNQMMANAEKIVKDADYQVALKLPSEETRAVDAAKISEIYSRRLGALAGFDGAGVEENKGDKSPKVINFINTVIQITEHKKNDRSKPTPGVKGSNEKNVNGRKENVIEGTVL